MCFEPVLWVWGQNAAVALGRANGMILSGCTGFWPLKATGSEQRDSLRRSNSSPGYTWFQALYLGHGARLKDFSPLRGMGREAEFPCLHKVSFVPTR